MVGVSANSKEERLVARPPSWSLALWWIVATVVGWVVGGTIGAAWGFWFLGTEVVGAVVLAAGLQSLVLCRWVRPGWWLASALLASSLVPLDILERGIGAASVGTVLGVLQWLVLRERVSRAGWWVVASTAGWILGGFLSGATEPPLGWAVIGAVYGAITGAVLVVLLGHSSSSAE